MYLKVLNEFAKNKLDKKDVAQKLGMTYNTLILKLKGRYAFTLDEALKLKAILKSNETVEELFKAG